MKSNASLLIEKMFDEIIEINGARGGEDNSIYTGIGRLKGVSVTFIAQIKEYDLKRCKDSNFSMTLPVGFRKVIRSAKQAERFRRPILFLVDTVGADASVDSEKQGQAYRIAECMYELMRIKVPIVSILCGEGGSGGALALCVADTLLATKEGHLGVASINACKSIIGEEHQNHFSKIYMNASELKEIGIIAEVLEENLTNEIFKVLCKLRKIPIGIMLYRRKRKFRYWDRWLHINKM